AERAAARGVEPRGEPLARATGRVRGVLRDAHREQSGGARREVGTVEHHIHRQHSLPEWQGGSGERLRSWRALRGAGRRGQRQAERAPSRGQGTGRTSSASAHRLLPRAPAGRGGRTRPAPENSVGCQRTHASGTGGGKRTGSEPRTTRMNTYVKCPKIIA